MSGFDSATFAVTFMNKSNLAAFFEDDEESLFPQKGVDDQKLSQYAHGTVRKSKREKEREAAEAKKREEEQEAARAYAEFVDAFETDGTSKSKRGAFVKAGGRGEEVYAPAPRETRDRDDQANRFTRSPEPSATVPLPRGKGKRAMDSFLEELKRDQADREDRLKRRADAHGKSVNALAAYETQSGSKDRGDPATSNIFVANLPQNITEATMGNFFARHGPVGSIKIMWPRGDASHGPGSDITSSRRTKSAGLSGFVSYMKRKDAEVAVREMDGFDWGGYILRVGWSKAVPVGPKAAYVPGPERSRSRSPVRRRYSRSRSRNRYHSRSRSRERSYHSRRQQSRSWTRSRSRSPPRRHRSRSPYRRRDIDPDAEGFIRTVAGKVREHGRQFEDVLRDRENGRPKFAFLWDGRHPEHRFYRSLLESDRGVGAGFTDDGYNSIYSTDSAEESEKERGRKGRLGRLARRRFEAMLRALSGRRGQLARCMAFSLEHAESAAEIVDIIVASLLVDGTPVPRKVARLYLICDILHNSAASIPNAWKFRQEFQSRLGLVFDHLSTIYHSFPGRITADSFKAQILAVVEVWEDWIVFPAEHTTELRARLEGSADESLAQQLEDETRPPEETTPSLNRARFKSSSFKPANEATNVEEQPSMDLDGEPIADDVDGEPLENVDGEPIDDMDGEPMGDVDAMNGAGPRSDDAMDDVDGEPM